MRIYNQGKDFEKQINLGDRVLYKNTHLSVRDGIVKTITQRGVNLKTDVGDRFAKWCNVISIEKDIN